jgi:hypothetical protein
MKIHPLGAKLTHVDRQADRQTDTCFFTSIQMCLNMVHGIQKGAQKLRAIMNYTEISDPLVSPTDRTALVSDSNSNWFPHVPCLGAHYLVTFSLSG